MLASPRPTSTARRAYSARSSGSTKSDSRWPIQWLGGAPSAPSTELEIQLILPLRRRTTTSAMFSASSRKRCSEVAMRRVNSERSVTSRQVRLMKSGLTWAARMS